MGRDEQKEEREVLDSIYADEIKGLRLGSPSILCLLEWQDADKVQTSQTPSMKS